MFGPTTAVVGNAVVGASGVCIGDMPQSRERGEAAQSRPEGSGCFPSCMG
jgi:hypothetical protein